MLTTIFQDRIKNEEEFFMPTIVVKIDLVYRISKILLKYIELFLP